MMSMKKHKKVIFIGLAVVVLLAAGSIMLVSETTTGSSKIVHFGRLESVVTGRGEVDGGVAAHLGGWLLIIG